MFSLHSLLGSLHHCGLTRDQADILREIMQADGPYPDEPPVLDDFEPPSDEDDHWWATRHHDPFADRSPVDLWEDLDLEPEPTASGGWDLPNGQFGHVREEP